MRNFLCKLFFGNRIKKLESQLDRLLQDAEEKKREEELYKARISAVMDGIDFSLGSLGHYVQYNGSVRDKEYKEVKPECKSLRRILDKHDMVF